MKANYRLFLLFGLRPNLLAVPEGVEVSFFAQVGSFSGVLLLLCCGGEPSNESSIGADVEGFLPGLKSFVTSAKRFVLKQ